MKAPNGFSPLFISQYLVAVFLGWMKNQASQQRGNCIMLQLVELIHGCLIAISHIKKYNMCKNWARLFAETSTTFVEGGKSFHEVKMGMMAFLSLSKLNYVHLHKRNIVLPPSIGILHPLQNLQFSQMLRLFKVQQRALWVPSTKVFQNYWFMKFKANVIF